MATLIIYRAPQFNKQIHLKVVGLKDSAFHKIESVEYNLFIGESSKKPARTVTKDAPNFLACSFTDISHKGNEKYYGTCKINYHDATKETELKSTNMEIINFNFNHPDVKKIPETNVDNKPYVTRRKDIDKYKGVEKVYISILFKKNGFDNFKNDSTLAAYNRVKPRVLLQETYTEKERSNNNLGRFAYHATIKGDLTKEEMIDITEELASRDDVIFAVLTPDFEGYEPKLPKSVETEELKNFSIDLKSTDTPDFEDKQWYLKKSRPTLRGLNVINAWSKTTGHAATIRLAEGGLREDHEDLEGNVIVVKNADNWQIQNNHATACCGIMAATKNGYGMTGIAHNASTYFYNLKDGLGEVLRDVSPGDVISVSLGWPGEIDLPLVVDRSWWEDIREVTNKGGLFVLAAGNGGTNISDAFENGDAEDFGDCGVFLAGGCDSREGTRDPLSNYNYHSSYVNAGFGFIMSTGYGTSVANGYGESHGINSYVLGSLSGTSFSTPQCAASFALIQSYAMEKYNIFFNREEMLAILMETGVKDALEDKIGYRPDVDEALSYIDRKVSETLVSG